MRLVKTTFLVLSVFLLSFSCDNEEAKPKNNDFYESTIPGMGSGVGNLDCEESDWIQINSGTWIIAFEEMPQSGIVNWNPEDGPYLVVFDEANGDEWEAISGSGKWSGSTFTYEAVVMHEFDYWAGNTEPTYTIKGQFSCPN